MRTGSRKSEDGRRKAQILITFALSLFLASSAWADRITLKDGKVYEGKILGKSDRRYLFSLSVDGDAFPISFFIDQVEKVEMSQDTVEKQIPYLKEVDILKVPIESN